MNLYTPKHLSLIAGVPQRAMEEWFVKLLVKKYTIGDLVRYEIDDWSLHALKSYVKGIRHGRYLVRKHKKETMRHIARVSCIHVPMARLSDERICLDCQTIDETTLGDMSHESEVNNV